VGLVPSALCGCALGRGRLFFLSGRSFCRSLVRPAIDGLAFGPRADRLRFSVDGGRANTWRPCAASGCSRRSSRERPVASRGDFGEGADDMRRAGRGDRPRELRPGRDLQFHITRP
jgi:hypothetical protein